MSSPEVQPPFEEPSSPIGRMQLGLAASFITPSPKKNHGDVERGVLNNGEHTLIPVTARMIHSAVWNSERFVLKDSRPLHMVKLVGAVRNFPENIKHVQIDVEDGTRLVRMILWRKEKECMAPRQMIHECNSNCYIRVIGEVEDYYGVHKIIAFVV